nr:Lycopene beta cyclase [Cytophagales bacterium]
MDYDLVVTGLGCAGLSFVYHLLNSPLKNQRILLIDNDPKQKNDRTWCYWSEEPLEIHPKNSPLVSWNNISLKNGSFTTIKPLVDLRYFQIKSSDFYASVTEKIHAADNITWMLDSVTDIIVRDGRPVVTTLNNGTVTGKKILNSIPLCSLKDKNYLKQVFLGWEIETSSACFDPSRVILMDFETALPSETAFVYILPHTKKRALVEYTLFTKEPFVAKTLLESKLKKYIQEKLGVDEYIINYREEGCIPMTTKNLYTEVKHPDLISLGSVAGCTKPSTGYTFHTIQKHSKQVIDALVECKGGSKLDWIRKARFSFYDNILLNIATRWPGELPFVFQDLFKKNNGQDILDFLNEETTFLQELSILSRLKFKIFIKSLLRYETH